VGRNDRREENKFCFFSLNTNRPMVIGGGEKTSKKKLGTIICVLAMILSMILTTTAIADWDAGDDHKMHWPQLPDLSDKGVDVSLLYQPLADDFLCNRTGHVTNIHIWGSFRDDVLPVGGEGSLTLKLSIYSNKPAGAWGIPWSSPRYLLWSREFKPGGYNVREITNSAKEDWYDPVTGDFVQDDHFSIYQYNFEIKTTVAFYQYEGQIYWLSVEDITESQWSDPNNPEYEFGWKSTRPELQWMDDSTVLTTFPFWDPLVYPNGHEYQGKSLDLAFVINGTVPPPVLRIPPFRLRPLTLNLKSMGRWVTGHITMPAGYDVSDINIKTVRLEYSIPADRAKVTGSELMLKFDRGDLEDIIGRADSHGKPAEFKVVGRLTDGTPFEGDSETIMLINPGK
jgi:hypothetical protein